MGGVGAVISFGEAPFLECSSKGDRRFSAFHARVKACRNRTIEDVYQGAKVFADGVTGLSWRDAKGRTAVNMGELRQLYTDLWTCYMEENPELMGVLKSASGLSDVFGQAGRACQAEELWKLRNAE